MVQVTPALPESVSSAWLEVLGHLHPLIVHFPIALAIVATLAMTWNWIRRHEGFGDFAVHCTWIAALASVVVSTSGWFFAEADGPESTELFLHRWFGIGSSAALVLLALATTMVRGDSWPILLNVTRLGSLVAAVGIGVTAHFGGDMVWGEGQVSKPLGEAVSLSWNRLRGVPESAVQSLAEVKVQEVESQKKDLPAAEPAAEPPSEPASEPAVNPDSDPAAMPEEKPEAMDDAHSISTLSSNALASIDLPAGGEEPPKSPPASAPATPSTKTPSIPKNLEYNKDIRPIFEARCWDCHGKGQAKGGIAFDHVGELIVKDKKKGIIVVDKPDASTLVKVIKRSATVKGHMPPKGDRLSAEQISLIENWIKQGAKVVD
ncbi:MAG: hypothetical protein K8R92_00410 [Planctomycetes bacterium]|nr:hypothetical protein [Planctomycetota bacterium]